MDNEEPTTVPGRNKGLVLMLDAHSDQLSPGSVDSDFRGFSAVVGPSNSFPLMSQDGLPIILGNQFKEVPCNKYNHFRHKSLCNM
jgi:hypothetical protein